MSLGYRLKGRDVQNVGMATHLIAKEKVCALYYIEVQFNIFCQIPALQADLAQLCGELAASESPDSHMAVKALLDQFHEQVLLKTFKRNFI